MRKIIIFIPILFLINGCTKHQKGSKDSIKDSITVITVDPTKARTIDLSDIYKNTLFIQLEINNDCLIGDIVGKVEVIDDRMFIYDSKNGGNLYCFGLDGKFLFNVSSRGQGPAEYINLRDFAIDRENECLWLSGDLGKMLKYDFSGKFIAKYDTEDFLSNNLLVIDSKEEIMAIRLGYTTIKDLTFIIYSINDNKILFQKKSINADLISSIGGHSINKSNDKIFYTEPFNDTIFTVSKEGIVPYYVIDFGKYNIPKELISNNPQIRNVWREINNPDNKYAGMFITNSNKDPNYLSFEYDFTRKKHTAIYSIESNKLININEVSFIGRTFETSSKFFHFKQDNKSISFLPAHKLTDKTLKEKQGQGYGKYTDINDLLPNLSEDDNPIMVIGEYNFDNLFK